MIFGYKKTKSFDLVDFYDWKLYYLRVTICKSYFLPVLVG